MEISGYNEYIGGSKTARDIVLSIVLIIRKLPQQNLLRCRKGEAGTGTKTSNGTDYTPEKEREARQNDRHSLRFESLTATYPRLHILRIGINCTIHFYFYVLHNKALLSSR